MRIRKENSIAVVIDIQEKLFPHIADNEELIRKNEILLEGLKALEIQVVVTEQYKKGLGETIEPIASKLGEFTGIEKIAFSCCDEPNFTLTLENSSRRNVIISGIEAHVCVLQTVIDLIDKAYLPVVVEDCISSRNSNDKKIAIERMRQEGAIITTCESLLFELCQKAGTPTFKAISKLVK